jgi:hypothetical protein
MLFPVCGDLFFSGHTVGLVLFACTWTRYGTPRDAAGRPTHRVAYWLVAAAAWALALAGMLALVAARFHYTIDILYGALITLLVWRTYDAYVDSA